MKVTRFAGVTAFIAILALAILFGLVSLAPPVQAQSTACYRMQGGAAYTCGPGGSVRLLSGATLDAQAGSTVTVSSTATINTLILTKQPTVTVTMNGIITPTGSYQPLAAAGTVGIGSIAAGSAGQLLRLLNVGSNTITISDTGSLMLASNFAMGQYDSLMLLSDGTNWIEMARSDN